MNSPSECLRKNLVKKNPEKVNEDQPTQIIVLQNYPQSLRLKMSLRSPVKGRAKMSSVFSVKSGTTTFAFIVQLLSIWIEPAWRQISVKQFNSCENLHDKLLTTPKGERHSSAKSIHERKCFVPGSMIVLTIILYT